MSFRIVTENTPFLTPLESAQLQQLKRQGGISNFKVTKSKSYYRFAGKTFDDAYKNMKIAAAKVIKDKTVSGGQPIGYTDIRFTSSRYTIRDGGSERLVLAYPLNLTVKVIGTITLPQWTEVEAATAEDKERWKKLFDDLNKHEQVHVCFALTAFDKIKQEFLGINGKWKTRAQAEADLKAKIKKVFDDITDELKAKQKKYDKDTDNGIKEIEQAEYNKLITSDCDAKYPKQ